MRIFTQTEKDAFISDSIKSIKIIFDKSSIGNITSSVELDSLNIEEILMSEDNLTFGDCNSSTCDFTITDTSLNLTGEYFSVYACCNTFNKKIFYGKVTYTTRQQNTNRVHITAHDILTDLNVNVADWYNDFWGQVEEDKKEYATLLEFRNSLLGRLGLTQEPAVLIFDALHLTKTLEPTSISAMDILKSVCEANAVFCHATENGTIEYISLGTEYETISGSCLYHPDGWTNKNYTTTKISGVHIQAEEGDVGGSAGTETNSYTITANFIFYDFETAELNSYAEMIYNKIRNITYYPFEATFKYLPWLEVGDRIKYDNRQTYILSRKISGTGLLLDSMEAQGLEDQEGNFGIQYDIQQLKGKSNTLIRNVNETVSTIKELGKSISEVKQTADSFGIKIKSLQDETAGNLVFYYTKHVPTLNNYPAVDWCSGLDLPFVLDEKAILGTYTEEEYLRHLNAVVYATLTIEGETVNKSYRFVRNEDKTFGFKEVSNDSLSGILSQVTELKVEQGKISSRVEKTELKVNDECVTRSEMESTIEQTEEKIDLKVKNNYTSKTAFVQETAELQSNILQTANSIKLEVSENYAKQTDLETEKEHRVSNIRLLSDKISAEVKERKEYTSDHESRIQSCESSIELMPSSIELSVKESIKNSYVSNSKLQSTEAQLQAEIVLQCDGIYSKVKENFVTTDGTSEFRKNITSEINQSAAAIKTKVAETYETKSNATTQRSTMWSSINQNAASIKTKVSSGNISSEISQEAGLINISSDRFSVDSTNFKLKTDGTLTCTSATMNSATITSSYLSNVTVSGGIYSDSGRIGTLFIDDSGFFSDYAGEHNLNFRLNKDTLVVDKIVAYDISAVELSGTHLKSCSLENCRTSTTLDCSQGTVKVRKLIVYDPDHTCDITANKVMITGDVEISANLTVRGKINGKVI